MMKFEFVFVLLVLCILIDIMFGSIFCVMFVMFEEVCDVVLGVGVGMVIEWFGVLRFVCVDY